MKWRPREICDNTFICYVLHYYTQGIFISIFQSMPVQIVYGRADCLWSCRLITQCSLLFTCTVYRSASTCILGRLGMQ